MAEQSFISCPLRDRTDHRTGKIIPIHSEIITSKIGAIQKENSKQNKHAFDSVISPKLACSFATETSAELIRDFNPGSTVLICCTKICIKINIWISKWKVSIKKNSKSQVIMEFVHNIGIKFKGGHILWSSLEDLERSQSSHIKWNIWGRKKEEWLVLLKMKEGIALQN